MDEQVGKALTSTIFSLLLVLVVLTQQVSSTQVEDFVECEPVDTACECDADATICIFQLYIERVFTFTKYNYSLPYSHGQGESYYINNIHGHSVHVLKVGHGKYSKENGSLHHSSPDLTCREDGNDLGTLDINRCPNPRFRSSNTIFANHVSLFYWTLCSEMQDMKKTHIIYHCLWEFATVMI
jgi:hypothetical protein